MGSLKYIITILSLFAVAMQTVSAQTSTGDAQLNAMSQHIKALGPYEVAFEMGVSGRDEKIEGSYTVDENRYMLYVADQKIYGDGVVRYTINDQNREVVIEELESSTPMIIANPAKAFLELNKSLNSEITGGYNDRMISLVLTPKVNNLLFRSCFLTISRSTYLPLFVSYETDEEHVSMRITNIRSLNRPLGSVIERQLEKIELPKGYEIIDIR